MTTSKTSETYKLLKGSLLNNQFRPSEPLRIDVISKSLNVSVGAVREALSRLTSDGLVDNVPQKGFIVAGISVDDLRDLTGARVDIESRCLELAIKRGDLAWEGGILSAYHRLSKTKFEPTDARYFFNPEWTEVHAEFHDSLTSACGSKWRLRLKDFMNIQAERYRRVAGPYVKERRDVDAEHKAIMEATLNRNAALACKLLAQHFEATAEIIISCGLLPTESVENAAE